MSSFKQGDEVFIRHLEYVKATVVGPRPGDLGEPEEHTRVVVKIAPDKRLCLLSELHKETTQPKPSADDWAKATQALQQWQANPSDANLRLKVRDALEVLGILKPIEPR